MSRLHFEIRYGNAPHGGMNGGVIKQQLTQHIRSSVRV